MPTYAYACTQCGHAFDAVQSFSDASLTECPQCGGLLRKQYGSIGVTFNGSGFYRTDSRGGSSGGSGSGAGTGSSKNGTPSGEKSSSSPSSKPEATASPASAGT
ncbi:FmdB family zinc ribbon protein [Microbacterium sp. bgisy189]|uniref:FmdB family zinc ribbon protein n=1 Tax=Microbacterium sp. bgisy189 TaxID=3413798 RepID=UPI003EB795DA